MYLSLTRYVFIPCVVSDVCVVVLAIVVAVVGRGVGVGIDVVEGGLYVVDALVVTGCLVVVGDLVVVDGAGGLVHLHSSSPPGQSFQPSQAQLLVKCSPLSHTKSLQYSPVTTDVVFY